VSSNIKNILPAAIIMDEMWREFINALEDPLKMA
jgi:hypothetical protein